MPALLEPVETPEADPCDDILVHQGRERICMDAERWKRIGLVVILAWMAFWVLLILCVSDWSWM